MGILTWQRITSQAPSQTQIGKAESEFGTRGNWTGRWGPAVFWLKVENHHQKSPTAGLASLLGGVAGVEVRGQVEWRRAGPEARRGQEQV